MARKTLQRVQGNKELEQVQRNVEDFVRSNQSDITRQGVLIGPVTISTTGTNIPHKLGRTPNGYIIVDATSSGAVYRTNWNDTSITLEAVASVSIKIWVF